MSTYRVTSFEDSVIFVYDVEKCLKKLDGFSQELIRRIALQEYTQGEAAGLLRVSLRTIVRRYGEAIDALTHIFVEHRLLNIDPMGESSTKCHDNFDNSLIIGDIARKCDGVPLCFTLLALSHGERRNRMADR